jgi:hypothetical protein
MYGPEVHLQENFPEFKHYLQRNLIEITLNLTVVLKIDMLFLLTNCGAQGNFIKSSMKNN